MFFLLIILGLPLFGLLWGWHADKTLRKFHAAAKWRLLLALFAGGEFLLFAWMILSRFLDLPDGLPVAVVSAVYIWHLLALPALLIISVIWAFARFTVLAAKRVKDWITKETERPIPSAPVTTRRQFLGAAVAAAPPLMTVAATGAAMFTVRDFRVRRIEASLAGLPPALDGLTIAHVSDIHVGKFTDSTVLKAIVDATNDLRTDLILLTGDLINNELQDLPAGLQAVKAMRSKYGAYMCEGNHDLIEDRHAFESRTKSSGVPLLIDEDKTLNIRGQAVQLLGLRWGRGQEAIDRSMSRLQLLRRPDAFQILLAHHPHAFDNAAATGIPLMLAGHTHGGQLMLNERLGVGPIMFKYWSGLYQQNNSALVVSNGVGNWFPLRTSAPAEIIHLTLRRQSERLRVRA